MAEILFTNVRILDGSGQMPWTGAVLVQGNRIKQVGRTPASVSAFGATVVDAAGATLMPGMVEAHTHFSWNDAATLQEIQRMPVEEHVLWCAKVAKRYLEAGWTSCVGAACAKPRLDVVIRDAINKGQIPGPRYLAASQEITVPGGLGDETLPHVPYPEFSFGVLVNGAEDMRRVVRMFLKYGVDSIKLNLSGDNFTPHAPATTTWMTDAEVAAAMEEIRLRGKRCAVHARSAASVKQALRHGVEFIYHASFTDEEALDMLEAQRDRIFVAPGMAILTRCWRRPSRTASAAPRRSRWATRSSWRRRSSRCGRCTSAACACCRVATTASPSRRTATTRATWSSSSSLGFTPMEAIRAATQYGGQIMMKGDELGLIREGYLADLLLVDGDPLANLSILRDPKRLLAVMKDGQFVKAPPVGAARTLGRAA
jgi:imidazolonepropionase-like amidohydrolase